MSTFVAAPRGDAPFEEPTGTSQEPESKVSQFILPTRVPRDARYVLTSWQRQLGCDARRYERTSSLAWLSRATCDRTVSALASRRWCLCRLPQVGAALDSRGASPRNTHLITRCASPLPEAAFGPASFPPVSCIALDQVSPKHHVRPHRVALDLHAAFTSLVHPATAPE
jgi:hypothetical protein